MCGIAGIYDMRSRAGIDRALLEKMCDALQHRGPDDSGIYCADAIGLGHRRLSIIDLEGGREPLANEDETAWLIFNGEIYNFQSLRDELAAKGHHFRTKSDAEVVLHLYEDMGEGCLDRLRGMFAFALWDARKKVLFLARDRVGIKPLHYSVSDGRVVFASELKAILACPWITRELDYEALHDYLTLMYVPAPKTIFKGILKLPAGHYALCGNDGVTVKEYWDIDFSHVSSDSEEVLCEKLYGKLKDAVGSELVSDVPLGAFLSGGVDSSAVVAMMSGLQKTPVITNSIGFADKRFDELSYARIVADRFSTDHHEYIVQPNALDVIEKLAWFYDEPFGDSSSIPTYYVSQMARQTVKVALSGDGGDENFAGYPRYAYLAAAAKLQLAAPGFIKRAARSAASSLGIGNPWAMKIKNKLGELHLPLFELYFNNISIFKEHEASSLYRAAMQDRLKGYSASSRFRQIFDQCRSNDPVSRFQYLDMKTSLPDDMLVKTDRASAANGLEVRVPLLDHELMEFAATIPSRLKVSGPAGKYIFKKTMSRILPSDVLYRKKMGFSVPLQSWLQTDLRKTVEGELFDKTGIVAELFNESYVRRLWQYALHANMRFFDATDFATRVWLLFIFSRWYKRFMLSF